MTKIQIKQNDLLIAWFMTPEPYVLDHDIKNHGGLSFHYHSEWDCLMSVVEKLNETGQIEGHMIGRMNLGAALVYGDIGKAYKEIVWFIKNYNRQNPIRKFPEYNGYIKDGIEWVSLNKVR